MERTSLEALDLIVIVVYLAIVVGKGYLLSRKQEDVETYLLAGRTMSYWVVAISIIASLLSAITYLGAPTEAFNYDFKLGGTLLCIPLTVPILIKVFLPFFYRLNVYTAYQYLEERFHVSVRAIASGLFILWRLGWMALVVYAPALAISELFNIPWWICVIIVGVASTVYTVMGGLTAVMWTDVMQFAVLFGGAFFIVYTVVTGVDGGFGYIWQVTLANDKLTMFDWTWDPFARLSTWAVLVGGLFSILAQYGTDQVAIQRYLSSKSKKEAERSLIFHGMIIVPVGMLFYVLGAMLWAFYHQHPELLAGFQSEQADRIMPYFIAQQLPVGFRGLLVAALFAATMSSIDSGINSIATTTLVDFYQGLFRRKIDEAAQLVLAKRWTLIWGLVATAAALLAGLGVDTLAAMANRIGGLFSGALLGIFLLGMMTRRANWQGALLGSIIGFGVTLLAAFGSSIAGHMQPTQLFYGTVATLGKLSFMWYAMIGAVLTFVAGWLLSGLFPPPTEEQLAPPEELSVEEERIPEALS